MPSLEQHLRVRASALRPTEGQFESARRSHLYLQKALDSGQMGTRLLRSFLSGSYARDTAIRPLDDVDIVFVVDGTAWKRSLLQRFLDAPPSPTTILESLARAIRTRYRQQNLTPRVRVQKRSVGLVMNHLTIDVVPAVESDDRDGYLLIPDTPTGGWLKTGPHIHAEIATRVNQSCVNTLKPLVRLLKGWNGSLASTVRLKSFAIETIATRLLAVHPKRTLLNGAFAFFDYLAGAGIDVSLRMGQLRHELWPVGPEGARHCRDWVQPARRYRQSPSRRVPCCRTSDARRVREC